MATVCANLVGSAVFGGVSKLKSSRALVTKTHGKPPEKISKQTFSFSTQRLYLQDRQKTERDTSARVSRSAAQFNSLKVSEYMTSPALSIGPDATIEEAIEMLVQKGVSGLPVTDATGKVLGVVSGLDIIALDKTPGHVDTSDGMFPKIGKCDSYSGDQKLMWSDFLELKEVASRASSTTVGQIMHDAFTISISDTVEDAASKVIKHKVHRLTVLDEDGKLAGVLSRGDIMRATLKTMQTSLSDAQ